MIFGLNRSKQYMLFLKKHFIDSVLKNSRKPQNFNIVLSKFSVPINVFGFLCPNYEILLILSFIVKEINQKYLRIYILGLLRLTLKILIGKPSFFEKDLLILEAVSL